MLIRYEQHIKYIFFCHARELYEVVNQYLVGLTFKGSFMELYSIVFGKAPVKNQYGKFWSTLFYSRVPHVHTRYLL